MVRSLLPCSSLGFMSQFFSLSEFLFLTSVMWLSFGEDGGTYSVLPDVALLGFLCIGNAAS